MNKIKGKRKKFKKTVLILSGFATISALCPALISSISEGGIQLATYSQNLQTKLNSSDIEKITSLDVKQKVNGSDDYEKFKNLSNFVIEEVDLKNNHDWGNCQGLIYLEAHQGVNYNFAIVGAGVEISGDVSIPAFYYDANGVEYPIIAIGRGCFKECNKMQSINFEKTKNLLIIGNEAFKNCSQLDNINLVNCINLTNLGESVFENCLQLKTIEFYNDGFNIQKIGNNAFKNCPKLSKGKIVDGQYQGISIENNNYTMANNAGDAAILLPRETNGVYNFDLKASDQVVGSLISGDLIVEDTTMTLLPPEAFYDCAGLTSINFSDCKKLKKVGDHAFDGCINLTTCQFYENGLNLTSIGESAFDNCCQLSCGRYIDANFVGISIENANYTMAKNVGNAAILLNSETKGIYDFSQPAKIRMYIPELSRYDTQVACGLCSGDLVINDHELTKLPDYAFYDCDGLKSVTIDNQLIDLGDYAFFECSNLQTFNVNSPSLKDLGKYTFANDEKLKNVDISACKEMTMIDDAMFLNCSSIEKLNLSKNKKIETIGLQAFSGCTLLDTVKLYADGKNISYVMSQAFQNCQSLSKGHYDEYEVFVGITINNDVYKMANNVGDAAVLLKAETGGTYDFSKQANTINGTIGQVQGSLCSGELTITDGLLTEVIDYAFSDCQGLTSINFASDVNWEIEKIGNAAFYECRSLKQTNVLESNSLISIEGNAFASCSSLHQKIVLPSSIENIGNYAFVGCSSIISLDLSQCFKLEVISNDAFNSCSSLLNIQFNENLVAIGNEAFANCSNLLTIDMKNLSKITYIGDNAFNNDTNVISVMFPNDDINIDIAPNAFSYFNDYAVAMVKSSAPYVPSDALQVFGSRIHEYANEEVILWK